MVYGSDIKETKKMETRKIIERAKFVEFCESEKQIGDGFDFAELFHECYNKYNAVFVGISDDVATVKTPFGYFDAGADGVTAYFMTEKPNKRVDFNRSVYFINIGETPILGRKTYFKDKVIKTEKIVTFDGETLCEMETDEPKDVAEVVSACGGTVWVDKFDTYYYEINGKKHNQFSIYREFAF